MPGPALGWFARSASSACAPFFLSEYCLSPSHFYRTASQRHRVQCPPLSLLRRYEGASPCTPRVLGVAEWGFQRKSPTGTLLVDLEQHRPVDLLLGSDDQVLTEWLRVHPGVKVISRDRGASYQKAATQAAPQTPSTPDGFTQTRSKQRKPPRRQPPSLSPRRAWQVTTYQQVLIACRRGESPRRNCRQFADQSSYGLEISAHAPLCHSLSRPS
jgi:hypothetical protein